MSAASPTLPRLDAEDRLRAELYDFLALLLSAPPDRALLDRTAGLAGDGSDLGRALTDLATRAAATDATDLAREYNALFIGLGRGEILPYASYYLTGFLNDKPLARLRGDMRQRGLARSANVSEPEDHISSLCEMMAGLILGRYGAPAPLADQKDLYTRHIGPWAPRFFADLTTAKTAGFYRAVGTLGLAFLAIEDDAFQRPD